MPIPLTITNSSGKRRVHFTTNDTPANSETKKKLMTNIPPTESNIAVLSINSIVKSLPSNETDHKFTDESPAAVRNTPFRNVSEIEEPSTSGIFSSIGMLSPKKQQSKFGLDSVVFLKPPN
jgi:hypothetical protein